MVWPLELQSLVPAFSFLKAFMIGILRKCIIHWKNQSPHGVQNPQVLTFEKIEERRKNMLSALSLEDLLRN